MTDRTTVFIRPPDERPETGFGLPTDLLGRCRRRVRIVSLLVLFGVGFDLVLMLAGVALHGTPDAGAGLEDVLPFLANGLTIVLSLALAFAASSTRVRHGRLVTLALTYEVLLCFIIAVSNPLSFYADHGVLPGLTWVTPLIIFFPMIVPCPPRRTLVTSIAAAATRPLGLFILAAAGRITATPMDYFSAAFSPTVAVVIAYFGARVIHGLGVEVAEARRMGNYELVRRLGQGGMGEVWLARHHMLARPAAVKLVRAELLGAGNGQQKVLERFEREAQATASMRSPHTISLYDYGVTEDRTLFYVMELLDGFDADTLVRRFGPLSANRTIHLLKQICHSLAEAHEAGLIHRDIKPANIYVCRYGRDVDFVKVLDFGLVRRTGDVDPGGGAEHVLTGTPAFMAPEQVTGHDRDDARVDIYAVGCLAYWLLTGRLVFEGASAIEVLTHHARTVPEPPSRRTDAPIPEALDRLVMSCLEKDPARRPAGALALSAMLSACTEAPWDRAAAVAWWENHAPLPVQDPADPKRV